MKSLRMIIKCSKRGQKDLWTTMWCILVLLFIVVLSNCVNCFITLESPKNISVEAIALSEIIKALNPSFLLILAVDNIHNRVVNDLIYRIHEMNFKTCIFLNKTKYFQSVGQSINASIESSSLIFAQPTEIITELHEKKSAHRLSLFMFYWNVSKLPISKILQLEEPIRVVIITRPRAKAFRIFYNQAIPSGTGNLRLVNWYDSESLGLYKTPLLPSATKIYSNFEGRIFYVPVIHSPPWFFLKIQANDTVDDDFEPIVLGGRDDQLLKLLADKMNFNFIYKHPPNRTQGSPSGDSGGESKEYNIFTGALGMIQNQDADFFLGDVGLSWERRKAVEFSFFTLADSGTFVTHAPRKLNEALALLRPFKLNVWPYLILTVVLSGPTLYFMIIMPYKWNSTIAGKPKDTVIYIEYINEITLTKKRPCKQLNELEVKPLPKKLLERCIWYSFQLFLKQACLEPYHGYRARFLIIVYWIAASYVLAALYAAQLTSQFARPTREASINDLFQLEEAMKYRDYKLYLEKDSLSLEILENSTEIFRRLNDLMRIQNIEVGDPGYLVDSIEQGVELVSDGSKNIILGGREALYFNIIRYGSRKFQMSYKLYTRYSAIAVQIGCPFLDSLNEVLMHAFEGGILDKITNIEYEKMSKIKDDQTLLKTNLRSEEVNAKQSFTVPLDEDIIKPLNLRMLQGAFIILLIGYVTAAAVLIFEISSNKYGNIFNSIKRISNKMFIFFILIFVKFIRYLKKK